MRVFSVLTIGCLLSGCMSSAMTSANAVYDHRSIQTNVQNHYQQVSLYHALTSNPAVNPASDLAVVIEEHVALIIGETPDQASWLAIDKEAGRFSGTQKVLNKVTIAPPVSMATKIHDTWITTKIKTQYIASNEINPSKIKVITDDGVVYLMGMAPREEANKAIEVASQTEGVKKVVTALYFLDASTV